MRRPYQPPWSGRTSRGTTRTCSSTAGRSPGAPSRRASRAAMAASSGPPAARARRATRRSRSRRSRSRAAIGRPVGRRDRRAHRRVAAGETGHVAPARRRQVVRRRPVRPRRTAGRPATASTSAAATTSGRWLIAATAASWAAASITTGRAPQAAASDATAADIGRARRRARHETQGRPRTGRRSPHRSRPRPGRPSGGRRRTAADARRRARRAPLRARHVRDRPRPRRATRTHGPARASRRSRQSERAARRGRRAPPRRWPSGPVAATWSRRRPRARRAGPPPVGLHARPGPGRCGSARAARAIDPPISPKPRKRDAHAAHGRRRRPDQSTQPGRCRRRSAGRTATASAATRRSVERRSASARADPGSSGGFWRRFVRRRSVSRRSSSRIGAAARAAPLLGEQRLERRRRCRSGGRTRDRRAWASAIDQTRGQRGQRGLDLLERVLVVLERAGQVALVRRQVEVAVAAQVEQDDLAPRRPRVAASASSMATRMAWVGSGAGRMPSARANCTPASKLARWWTLRASMKPCSLSRLTSGDMPW